MSSSSIGRRRTARPAPVATSSLGRRSAVGGVAASLAAATAAGFHGPAAALAGEEQPTNGFPERPIRVLVPFAARGATDVQMRALCDLAARRLGQPVLAENRPGAGGILGAQLLATGAAPDGHTLSQMPAAVFRVPLMSLRPPFDPMADFTWIIQLTGYLFGVVVRADAPWRSFREFLAHAKARPGDVTYGTPGATTTPHVAMERIAGAEGITWVHVPYRGTAENVEALLAGHIQAAADSSGWAPLVEEGRLRLLCTWGAERARRFPDAPTLVELGHPGMVITSSYGIAGPKGMAPGVVRVLHDAFREALFDPAHLAVLDRYDMPLAYLDSAAYAAAARRRYEDERALLERLGARPARPPSRPPRVVPAQRDATAAPRRPGGHASAHNG